MLKISSIGSSWAAVRIQADNDGICEIGRTVRYQLIPFKHCRSRNRLIWLVFQGEDCDSPLTPA